MKHIMITAAALAASTGCTTTGTSAPAEPAGACQAEAASGLVGRDPTPDVGAEAQRLTGARAIRWIRPGDMVTMDFRADRLNVEIGESGKIERFRCG